MTVRDFTWTKNAAGGWKAAPCPLGEGMVDWRQFFTALARVRFVGPITIEVRYEAADELSAFRLPPWENIIVINSVSRNGIVFGADTLDSAITFAQPHGRPQPIKWRYAAGTKEASLTVSPEDGTLKFDGGGITASGGLLDLTGLSGTGIAAHNLRGINVSVATGSNELQVKFVKPEADVNYAIFVEPSWLTAHAVTLQTVHGFTVTFAHAPKKPATLHWLLVR